MPEKLGQRLLWIVVNAVVTLSVGFLLLSLTAKGEKWLRTEKAINKKADVEYVDRKDAELKADIRVLKVDTEKDTEHLIDNMNKRFDDQDKKLDLVIKIVEK